MQYKIGDKIRIIENMVFFCENNIGKVDSIVSIEDYGIILEKYGMIPIPALKCIIKVDDNENDILIESVYYSPIWVSLSTENTDTEKE